MQRWYLTLEEEGFHIHCESKSIDGVSLPHMVPQNAFQYGEKGTLRGNLECIKAGVHGGKQEKQEK